MLNGKRFKAFITGVYICDKCGARMKQINEDEWYCPACGIDIDTDHYGYSEEEYENLYPTIDEVLELYTIDDECVDCYEEVCDELSHDD